MFKVALPGLDALIRRFEDRARAAETALPQDAAPQDSATGEQSPKRLPPAMREALRTAIIAKVRAALRGRIR